MNWHLFKGGVRTKTMDHLLNEQVLEQAWRDTRLQNDFDREEQIKNAEKYQEKKKEVKKEDGLRKRRESISTKRSVL